MGEMISVRPEEVADIPNIYNINVSAFGKDDEARLVDGLRRVTDPFISLVAEENGSVVGHILFTPVRVGESSVNALGLGPMAVAPESQGKGVGTELIESGLEICREKGASAVFVLGHPEYYTRFGFKGCANIGIYYKNEEFAPFFFYIELREGALDGVRGNVEYNEAFDEV